MQDILDRNNAILRQKARAVQSKEFSSEYLKGVIARMSKAMHSQKDGIAIAAPQIGESIRLFVVAGELLSKVDHDYKGPAEDLIFINPKIIKLSKEKEKVEEGCLSVRWLYGMVNRSKKAVLSYQDQNGRKIERGASGLLAQIFQHECDHLEGILFTDNATELWEMDEEEIRELQAK